MRVTQRFYCRLLAPVALGVLTLVLTHAPVGAKAPHARAKNALVNVKIPAGVEQLREMQSRIRRVTQQVRRFTVGVRIGTAQGTGVIVSRDGYVLTAAHVTERPGKYITVILPDGRMARGKTLGVCRSMDAAMIKITHVAGQDKVDLPFAEMALSYEVDLGQWCLALGHPGGYEEARPAVLRCGRIIDLGRSHLTTDCTLISGDSGGPLFDLDGRIIAIHSRIGLELVNNVHTPIAVYREQWDRFVAGEDWGVPIGGKPFLGVKGRPDGGRAEVLEVIQDSPAAKAGIRKGDVILKFGNTPIPDFSALIEAVRVSVAGEKVDVQIHRRGKTQTIPVLITASEKTSTTNEQWVRNSNAERDTRPMSLLSEIKRLRAPGIYEKNHSSILSAFSQSSQPIQQRTVRLLSEGQRSAIGVCVGPDLVLTKASQLAGQLQCRLPNGKTIAAKIVRSDKTLDLALLRVSMRGAHVLTPVPSSAWSTSAEHTVGSWLITPGTTRDPVSIGVLSLSSRKIRGGVLGVLLTNTIQGPSISRIIRNSGAEKAGLHVNDIITHLNGKRVRSSNELIHLLANVLPGDSVQLAIQTSGQSRLAPVVLGEHSAASKSWDPRRSAKMAGPLSKRRSGFPSAIQHDSLLRPEDCGGPLLDIDGRIVGLNIARAGRVASYALPANVVKKRLDSWLRELAR